VFKLVWPYPFESPKEKRGHGAFLLTPKDPDLEDREGYIHAA